ncbi:type I restriction enzyme M protein [Runella defluvii]|uniref:site-specific DNA-methyltransferase (adenine-specific) n=2 Tax=Runella defluvii TaxID=370973 RepID=A0A7W5ZJ10_9BACT|nr:type I restriction enzyme M protein [Runella defluvii]
MTYLLFMKRIDELDTQKMRDKEKGHIQNYTSIFDGTIDLPNFKDPIPKETLRWSAMEGMKDDEMLYHLQQKVFPFIKQLGGENSFFTKHMDNAVFLIPKPSLMRDAYRTINEIYSEIDREISEGTKDGSQDSRALLNDIQGDVYEHLLDELKNAGKNGQFRTRTHIVQLVVELVFADISDKNVFLDENFRIADPACGSTTFLLGAFKYILTQFTSDKYIKPSDDNFMIGTTGDLLPANGHKKLEEDTFFGYDIDPTMVRIGLMNMLMHGITQPHIDYKDTLSKNYNEEARYKAVFANPPFTGSIDKEDINDNLSLKKATNKTELLFIERIHKMLTEDGTAGIIIPQGVLFGSGKAFVETRKLMIEQAELKAVVTMPSGVFKPYAGVATAILIFTKGRSTENVWFYEMKSDGYTLDDKRNPDHANSDLQDIIARFKTRNPQTDTDRTGSVQKCFFVPKAEIVENNYDLSLNKYKQQIYEEVTYIPPKDILAKLKTLEDEIQNDLAELQSIFQ